MRIVVEGDGFAGIYFHFRRFAIEVGVEISGLVCYYAFHRYHDFSLSGRHFHVTFGVKRAETIGFVEFGHQRLILLYRFGLRGVVVIVGAATQHCRRHQQHD